MTDIIDRAQAVTDFYLRQQLAGTAADPAAISETHCTECGEPIPDKRRQAVPGCRHCIVCQQKFEETLK